MYYFVFVCFENNTHLNWILFFLIISSDLASPEPLRRTSRAKRRLLTDPVSSPLADDSQKEEDVTLKTGMLI